MGRMLRSSGPALAALLVWALALPTAAAPYVGKGQAPVGEGADRAAARKVALERARKAALEAALAEMQGLAAGSRERAMTTASAWTSAYRVLSQTDDGATLSLEIEAEIDVARLEKAMRPGSAPAPTRPRPQLAAVDGEGCPPEVVAALRDELVARGLVATSGGAGEAKARVRCGSLGVVEPMRVHGASVTVEVQIDGALPVRGDAEAFGGDLLAAQHQALRRAAAGVADTLVSDEGGVVLRVLAPWPAAKVRRLERAIGASVVGVRKVGVAGIEGDGTVRLRVDGELSAEDLASRVGALQVPGVKMRRVAPAGPGRVDAEFEP